MERAKKKHIETDALIYFGLGYASVSFPDSSVAGPSGRVIIQPNAHTTRFPLSNVDFLGPVVIRWDVWERVTERIDELGFDRLEIRQAIGDKNIGFLSFTFVSPSPIMILVFTYNPNNHYHTFYDMIH